MNPTRNSPGPSPSRPKLRTSLPSGEKTLIVAGLPFDDVDPPRFVHRNALWVAQLRRSPFLAVKSGLLDQLDAGGVGPRGGAAVADRGMPPGRVSITAWARLDAAAPPQEARRRDRRQTAAGDRFSSMTGREVERDWLDDFRRRTVASVSSRERVAGTSRPFPPAIDCRVSA